MSYVKSGDIVKTSAMTGLVVAVIDGRPRGWMPTLYYLLDVLRPYYGVGHRHIIRLDEITRIL